MYTTPKSYLELLKLFIALLETKHVEADAAIQRLEGGVLKLAESAEAVANLEENLKVRHRIITLLEIIYTQYYVLNLFRSRPTVLAIKLLVICMGCFFAVGKGLRIP